MLKESHKPFQKQLDTDSWLRFAMDLIMYCIIYWKMEVTVWDCFWILSILVLSLFIYVRAYRKASSACVIVLGDFGRSPRMQYHTISLAETYYVTVVANGGIEVLSRHLTVPGSKPLEEILSNPKIRIITIPVCPPLPKGSRFDINHLFLNDRAIVAGILNVLGLPKVAFLLYAPIKVAMQVFILIYPKILIILDTVSSCNASPSCAGTKFLPSPGSRFLILPAYNIEPALDPNPAHRMACSPCAGFKARCRLAQLWCAFVPCLPSLPSLSSLPSPSSSSIACLFWHYCV